MEELPAGTVLDGKFRILRCLGSGGMGAVYEVQHELTRHRRALKLLHPAFATQREPVERFLREASVAGRIENPHITETYDAGWLSTGVPYVVMECLEGETLGQKLAREGVLALDFLLPVIAQTCRGLTSAHEAGIVHRDLKPDNLFLTEREGAPFVKILDFGISKFEDLGPARPTQDGAFMGTPWYMSPEQFLDGKTVDARADIYSLGVIFFECATGRHPYPADTLAKLATKIMVDEVPPPSKIRAALPAGVDAVIARALRKEPSERYQSATAMAEAVESIERDGARTLPQGSFWSGELPARPQSEPDRSPMSSAPTTLASGGPIEREVRRPRWWLAAIPAAVVAAAIAFLLLRPTPIESEKATTPSEETPATATPESAPPASESALANPTGEPSADPLEERAEPIPTATVSPKTPPAPLPVRPSAPKPDYATMEEFPE